MSMCHFGWDFYGILTDGVDESKVEKWAKDNPLFYSEKYDPDATLRENIEKVFYEDGIEVLIADQLSRKTGIWFESFNGDDRNGVGISPIYPWDNKPPLAVNQENVNKILTDFMKEVGLEGDVKYRYISYWG